MEMRFYELIGIKYWKRLVLWFIGLFYRKPEKRKGGNYWLESISVDGIKNFKEMLILNALLHTIASIFNTIWLVKYHFFVDNIPLLIFYIVMYVVNGYCIILQRYNWLRIKKTLKKISSRK